MSTSRDYRRLDRFLDALAADVYPEPESALHNTLSQDMLERLLARTPLAPGAKVLDVGCGAGVGLALFAQRGFDARGVTLGDADIAAARARGFAVQAMDQSFLEFADAAFDLVWARHVLEHSIFPFFTLVEMNRVLKPGGLFYMEVPAPETACHHEQNPNHYSVLGKGMWMELLYRSGFVIDDVHDIEFTVPLGPDAYWAFFCRKDAADGAAR